MGDATISRRSQGMRIGSIDGTQKYLPWISYESFHDVALPEIESFFRQKSSDFGTDKMACSRKELEKLTDHLFQLMFIKSFKLDVSLSRSTHARERRLSNSFLKVLSVDIIPAVLHQDKFAEIAVACSYLSRQKNEWEYSNSNL